jgi:hypothetical protein
MERVKNILILLAVALGSAYFFGSWGYQFGQMDTETKLGKEIGKTEVALQILRDNYRILLGDFNKCQGGEP